MKRFEENKVWVDQICLSSVSFSTKLNGNSSLHPVENTEAVFASVAQGITFNKHCITHFASNKEWRILLQM